MNTDKPGAAFDIESEVSILLEAQRLIKSGELKKHTWMTWDSFAGHSVYNEETDEQWLRRAIRKAVASHFKEGSK